MDALVFLIISIVCFGSFILLSFLRNRARRKKSGGLTPANLLTIGTFLASVVLFIPLYYDYFNGDSQWFRIILLSIHNTLRLFVVDSDFDFVVQFGISAQLDPTCATAYQIMFAIYYVIAPFLTFGFVLSLFQNLSARIKLFFCFFSDVYVFSELNEKSISLATDIFSKKKATFVFTNVNTKEVDGDLLEKALGIGSIIFSKSVLAINFKYTPAKKTIFFLIGKNEEENISKTAFLVEKYNEKKWASLYLFSTTNQSELILDSLPENCQMKIRRINGNTCLINRYLFDNGKALLNSAHAVEDGQKVISSVVIGMGGYGTAMAKTLPWFCQLPGYHFKMNAFDSSPFAEDKFRELCPDYLSPECNRVYVEGEAQYDITIHSGVDYKSYSFGKSLESIKDASFVFIDLGDDESNIACALTSRMHFERIGLKPEIVTCVFNKDKIKHVEHARANDGKEFNITYVSALDELYSAKVIINSELEKRALNVHMSYLHKGASLQEQQAHERIFWLREYNYNSSCASALHEKIRVECGVAGADKEVLTEEQRNIITVTEHRRWNAYVRSCGYVYSGSPEKASRNEIAKMHNCLIPFKDLSEEYQKIDANVTVDKTK